MKDGATASQVEADLADLSENAGYVLPASLLEVTSIEAEMRQTMGLYVLFVLLAVTCAAWIVYTRCSGGSLGRVAASRLQRCRWWLFFITKSVLLLIATGLLVWASVRWISVYFLGSIYPLAGAIAGWLFLVLSIAPLTWSIHDQQKRCRVCLRRLGTPVRIGVPGHVLLNWSGTEMVCSAGHGALYLPDSETNWLERDRWNSFDDSWADLFCGES
jgi:Zn-dependent protease with chaperone function